jgi:hypothetical protein
MVDDLVGLLKLSKESVESIFNRVSTAHEKPWDELTFALDKLTELVKLQVEAVAEVSVSFERRNRPRNREAV